MPPKKENTSNSNGNNNSSSSISVVPINGLQNSSSTTTAAAATAPTNTANNTIAAASTAAATSNSNNNNVSASEQAAEQRQQLFHANAKLCRMVRKCPWMYDRNHPNYAKKQILDKSWLKIAKDCDDSMASCKERWRNIRAAFARSINIYKTHGGPNRVKPYYLHNELRFLVKPMLEGQKEKSNLSLADLEGLALQEDKKSLIFEEEEEEADKKDKKDEDDVEEEEEEEEEEKFEAADEEDDETHEEFEENTTMDHDQNHVEEHSNLQPQLTELTSDVEAEFNFPDEMQPVELTPNRAAAHRRNFSTMTSGGGGGVDFSPDECDEPKRLKLCHTLTVAGPDADARFLETLLPDMRMMNARQKVIFKRKIYQSLEEVFETSADFPNCIASFMPSTCPTTSSAALSVAQSVVRLSEADLLKLSDFMKRNLCQPPSSTAGTISVVAASRLQNGGGGGGVVTSTPTQVGIIPGTNTTITRTSRHQTQAALTTTTTPQTRRMTAREAAAAATASTLSPWDQLVPISVKEEIEDVEVD